MVHTVSSLLLLSCSLAENCKFLYIMPAIGILLEMMRLSIYVLYLVIREFCSVEESSFTSDTTVSWYARPSYEEVFRLTAVIKTFLHASSSSKTGLVSYRPQVLDIPVRTGKI